MRISVSRSRAVALAFADRSRSSSSVHGPSFGRGWTSRSYENAVSPDRRIRRTLLRTAGSRDLRDRLPLAQTLATYPTYRLHSHIPTARLRQSRQPIRPKIGGSILHADDAPQGVGLHAETHSVDEKSQIQALDRTQPGLPLKKGRAGTMTHDYKRNGTTTLFAAMNVLDGTVIGRNMQRHRHQEFIRFLNAVEREVPAGKTIHAVLDNYAAHKHPVVRRWLARHPRWTFHFTPTSASWLNAVEGFFAILTKRRLKRGVFRSVTDLQAAINRFLEDHNTHSKPFQWVADPDKIIAAVRRGHQALDSIH